MIYHCINCGYELVFGWESDVQFMYLNPTVQEQLVRTLTNTSTEIDTFEEKAKTELAKMKRESGLSNLIWSRLKFFRNPFGMMRAAALGKLASN